MRLELDHFFVCVDAAGAAEAEALAGLGLREGPPNDHPGQGTASRRFSFANAMIELVWVTDAAEVRSERTRRTLLWERWSGSRSGSPSGRGDAASPFGFCLRPLGLDSVALDSGIDAALDSENTESRAPFPAWQYRPAYLEAPLFMDIGEAGVEEPMWVVMNFMRRSYRERNFVEHPAEVREITGLTLTTPVPLSSGAARVVVEAGILRVKEGVRSLLEVEFDGARDDRSVDLTERLPLVFRF